MQATERWQKSTGGEYRPRPARLGFVQLAGYSAEYRIWGDGPPLILLPGLAGGIDLLGPIINQLSDSFQVISYQLRGEDNCFTLRRPFTLDDLVADLHEFIENLRLETPALMGVSFGGMLALEFASLYSGRLSRLIVQGTGAHIEPGLLSSVASTVLNRFPLPSDNPFVNQFFNLLFGGKRKRDGLFDFVTRQCWTTDQSVMAHRFHLVEQFHLDERLGDIRVPTLLVGGDRDVLVSSRSLNLMCERIPNVQFARVRQGGHLAFVTKPQVVADHVRRFLIPEPTSAAVDC